MKYSGLINKRAKRFRMSLAIALALATQALSATEQAPEPYHMAVISDAAYGEVLLLGDYGLVIKEFDGKKIPLREQFPVHNNLCVAYVMAKDTDNAERACDVAVTVGKRGAAARDLAVALMNRGVVRAISGDNAGARQDFKLAIRTHRGLKAPNENLARLESREGNAVASL